MSVSAFQKATIEMIAGTFKLPASTHARLFKIFYPDGSQEAKLDQGSFVLTCHLIAEQWALEPLEYPKGYETPERFQHFVNALHCSVSGNAFCRVVTTPYNMVLLNVVGLVGLVEPLRPKPKAIVLWNPNHNKWLCELQQEGQEAEPIEFETFDEAFVRAVTFANSVKPFNRQYWKANRNMVIGRLIAQYKKFETDISMADRIDSALNAFSGVKDRLFEAIRTKEQS